MVICEKSKAGETGRVRAMSSISAPRGKHYLRRHSQHTKHKWRRPYTFTKLWCPRQLPLTQLWADLKIGHI